MCTTILVTGLFIISLFLQLSYIFIFLLFYHSFYFLKFSTVEKKSYDKPKDTTYIIQGAAGNLGISSSLFLLFYYNILSCIYLQKFCL